MATLTVTQKVEKDVRYLKVEAGVRYWEDATVNGVEDEDGTLIPCRVGDIWCPVINLSAGEIEDWPAGVVASTYYKVCDAGVYTLLDADRNQVCQIEGYVPGIMCPGGAGYGDYIIMQIDESGRIANWSVPLDEFEGVDV